MKSKIFALWLFIQKFANLCTEPSSQDMPGGSEGGAACIPITCHGAEEECEGAEPGERMSLGRVVTEVFMSLFFMGGSLIPG